MNFKRILYSLKNPEKIDKLKTVFYTHTIKTIVSHFEKNKLKIYPEDFGNGTPGTSLKEFFESLDIITGPIENYLYSKSEFLDGRFLGPLGKGKDFGLFDLLDCAFVTSLAVDEKSKQSLEQELITMVRFFRGSRSKASGRDSEYLLLHQLLKESLQTFSLDAIDIDIIEKNSRPEIQNLQIKLGAIQAKIDLVNQTSDQYESAVAHLNSLSREGRLEVYKQKPFSKLVEPGEPGVKEMSVEESEKFLQTFNNTAQVLGRLQNQYNEISEMIKRKEDLIYTFIPQLLSQIAVEIQKVINLDFDPELDEELWTEGIITKFESMRDDIEEKRQRFDLDILPFSYSEVVRGEIIKMFVHEKGEAAGLKLACGYLGMDIIEIRNASTTYAEKFIDYLGKAISNLEFCKSVIYRKLNDIDNYSEFLKQLVLSKKFEEKANTNSEEGEENKQSPLTRLITNILSDTDLIAGLQESKIEKFNVFYERLVAAINDESQFTLLSLEVESEIELLKEPALEEFEDTQLLEVLVHSWYSSLDPRYIEFLAYQKITENERSRRIMENERLPEFKKQVNSWGRKGDLQN